MPNLIALPDATFKPSHFARTDLANLYAINLSTRKHYYNKEKQTIQTVTRNKKLFSETVEKI